MRIILKNTFHNTYTSIKVIDGLILDTDLDKALFILCNSKDCCCVTNNYIEILPIKLNIRLYSDTHHCVTEKNNETMVWN